MWFKKIYPHIEKGIEKIPMKTGKVLTWGLLVFMCCNILLSCLALIRYDQRENSIAAEAQWQKWMDAHYDDETMIRIYPNAKSVEEDQSLSKK